MFGKRDRTAEYRPADRLFDTIALAHRESAAGSGAEPGELGDQVG
jgi:hypothetical protein